MTTTDTEDIDREERSSVVIECPIVKGKGASREDVRDSFGSRWDAPFRATFMVNLSEETIRLIDERTLATRIQLKPGKQQVSCTITGMEKASICKVKDERSWTSYIDHIFILKGELRFQGSCRDGVSFTIPLYRTDKRTGTICITGYA